MKDTTVTITRMINGGYGLATMPSGQTALIHQVLPSEEISLTVLSQKRNHLIGYPRKIHQPHPKRRTPPCPYYHDCGGCDLQHAPYDLQLAIKEEIFSDLLSRNTGALAAQLLKVRRPLAGITSSDDQADEVEEQFGYRQRIRLQVSPTGELGFNRLRSHKLIPINCCMLASPAINTVLASLGNSAIAGKLFQFTRELELLLNPASGKVVALLHFQRKIRPTDQENAHRLVDETEMLERLFFQGSDYPLSQPFAGKKTTARDNNGESKDIQGNRLEVCYSGLHHGGHGDHAAPRDHSTQQLPDICYSWEVGGFCQVNLSQNRRLIQLVLDAAAECSSADSPITSILDLYCGMGNFSIPLGLAYPAAQLCGFEGQGSAIRSAVLNAEHAGLDMQHTSFRKKPIHDACAELIDAEEQFDCVVIDPPRLGAPNLAHQLAQLTRRRLIYISCDPATLCRDLTDLCANGFTVHSVQPVDMFPQTHHIETVAVLDKAPAPNPDQTAADEKEPIIGKQQLG